MVVQTQEIEVVTKEVLDDYVIQAARAAGYERGFGLTGCDLSISVWWAAYCRQSLDQQAHNNRLPEYLLTLARMAKVQGVVVPRDSSSTAMLVANILTVRVCSF